MRWGTLLTGMVMGAGAYYYIKDRSATIRQAREARHRRIEERLAHEELEEMIDDVVHRDDIPETPVKQAFEQAIGEHEHPAGR